MLGSVLFLGVIDVTADRPLQLEYRTVRNMNEPVRNVTLDCGLGWHKPRQVDLWQLPGIVDLCTDVSIYIHNIYIYQYTCTQSDIVCQGVREGSSRRRSRSLRRSVNWWEESERKPLAQGVQETQLIAACGPPGGGRMEATIFLEKQGSSP